MKSYHLLLKMGGLRGYYAKGNKSVRERQIPSDDFYLYVESKNQKKQN